MTEKPLENIVQCKTCFKVETEKGWTRYQLVPGFGYYVKQERVTQTYCPPCAKQKQKEVFDVDDFMRKYYGR